MRKTKKFPRLSALKRKAPKVPDLTCPIIDDVIENVENKWNGKTFSLKKREFQTFKKRMEEIRSANDGLRDSGRYWYDQTREIIDPTNCVDYESN